MGQVYHRQEGSMMTQRHRSIRIGHVLMGLAVLWGIIGLSGIKSWASVWKP